MPPVRTFDKASPLSITPTLLLASLLGFGAWCLYENRLPSLAIQTTPLDKPVESLVLWPLTPPIVGLIILALGLITLTIGLGVSLSTLRPIQGMSVSILLVLLLPLVIGLIYYFGTGDNFVQLSRLLILSLVITVAALISSQSQVNV
jgi:putative effector of murein hydrolase LrgA (UPF0299 family)